MRKCHVLGLKLHTVDLRCDTLRGPANMRLGFTQNDFYLELVMQYVRSGATLRIREPHGGGEQLAVDRSHQQAKESQSKGCPRRSVLRPVKM